MSEVKRYLIQKTPIGTMMKPNAEGNWIAYEDFYRVTAELSELRHAVWHALDDSGDTPEGDFTIAKFDHENLSRLVPEDHDGCLSNRVTAERDAALEEVEALKHWRDLALQFDNHRLKALWHLKTLVSDGAHYDAAAAFLAEPPIAASELQQRLTAAESDCIKASEHYLRKIADCANLELRVGQLLELLREAHPFTNDVAHDPDVWMKIDAALKPAEGGGDD